jgi:hypothetical protein
LTQQKIEQLGWNLTIKDLKLFTSLSPNFICLKPLEIFSSVTCFDAAVDDFDSVTYCVTHKCEFKLRVPVVAV